MTIASLKGIGSVYLITFMYFITQGEMRIYDIFAMMALDAIYPSNVQDELSFGSLNSLYIGANVKPRDLPQKDQLGFKNLFSDNKRYNKTYQIYIKKLNQFVEDYNKELPEGQKVTYENVGISTGHCGFTDTFSNNIINDLQSSFTLLCFYAPILSHKIWYLYYRWR